MVSHVAFRLVLLVAAAFIVMTGVNIGFGGIVTLGWQGSSDFLTVTNSHAYQLQDSHIRFLGGLWLGVGLALLFGAWDFQKWAGPLKISFVLIFIGGVMRFASTPQDVLLSQDIIGSLAAEVILMPFLYLWLTRNLIQQAAEK